MRTLRAALVTLLLSATLTLVAAQPATAQPPRDDSQISGHNSQTGGHNSQTSTNRPPTPKVVCCAGPGYALIFDLPATVKIVFTKAVRKWLFVSVLEGCKPCLLWVMVDMANRAMPERVRPCVKLPIIGVICAPSLAVRGPFIHDVKTRLSEAYQAIGMSEVYYNDCLFWRGTGSRYFSHTTTGCRA